MQALWEIEQIKQLKAVYMRTLDCNEWTEFGDCLTEDCDAKYSDGKLVLNGREAIVAFMSKHMSAENIISTHQAHHPEVSLADDQATASGVWYLQDTVIDLDQKVKLFGAAIYHDSYRKEEGVWRISATSYTRTYECIEPLPQGFNLAHNMFATD